MRTLSRELFKTVTKILAILFECSTASICIKNLMQSYWKNENKNKKNTSIPFQGFMNGFSFKSSWTMLISFPVCPEKGTCTISGYETFVFWKIWRALFSCHFCFRIFPFVLLPTIYPGQLGITKKRIHKPLKHPQWGIPIQKQLKMETNPWTILVKKFHHRCCDRVLNTLLIT